MAVRIRNWMAIARHTGALLKESEELGVGDRQLKAPGIQSPLCTLESLSPLMGGQRAQNINHKTG